jgi:hypothetical protein
VRTELAAGMAKWDLERARRKRTTRERRVVLQRPAGVNDQGGRVNWAKETGDWNAWAADMRHGVLSGVNVHPVARLTDDGVDFGVAPKPGDQVAYGMCPHRTDDCLQAAIATATQVPIEQVPDLKLDRRRAEGEDPDEISRSSWERLERWAAKRGLVMRFWLHPPPPAERWIGVVRWRGEEMAFGDHCLVMLHDRLLFDPSASTKPQPGTNNMRFTPNQIDYAITFDRQEDL